LRHDKLMAEIIGRRAYEIYLDRGQEHGSDREDWLQAETEVLDALLSNRLLGRLALLAAGFSGDHEHKLLSGRQPRAVETYTLVPVDPVKERPATTRPLSATVIAPALPSSSSSSLAEGRKAVKSARKGKKAHEPVEAETAPATADSVSAKKHGLKPKKEKKHEEGHKGKHRPAD